HDVYQQALVGQSLKGVAGQASDSSLDAAELARVGGVLDGIGTERVALVPLPVKPITLGDETYFEPQRDQVADLVLSWWGVRLAGEDGTLRLIIYNGSGIPGIAGEAAQALISAGMRVVDTRNADRFDYRTTLFVVQRGDLARASEVRAVLGVGEVVDQPTQQNVADIIVIIGSDWTPPKE
ncbi:MAG TPA: LytR C-terminal domain-containing protein, partial [Coriobacteriia bacterium]|nr:LytR C-terminal domain-containing protein [Coriobacteriia bacterium]